MGRIDPDPAAARRQELAAFLKARRQGLQPGDLGLRLSDGRRRTPGLRREEVAQAAGMSVTWYTWLEQGRQMPTSAPIIDAVSRALRLDRAADEHLRSLASLPTHDADDLAEGATPELTRLLDTLVPAPACLLNSRFDFVAWNEPFGAIWDPGALPSGRCNLMWLTFADAAHRDTWVVWEDRSRELLGKFRAAAGQHAGDARFSELVEALNTKSEEFASWWANYEVRQTIAGPLAIRLSDLGTIRLDVIELRTPAPPPLTVAIHTPVRPSDKRKLDAFLEARDASRHRRVAPRSGPRGLQEGLA